MHESSHWRDVAAERAWLRTWQAEGALGTVLPADALCDPPSRQWRRFLDRLALWLGVALCAAGAICYVAANWAHLGKFERLAGAQALLVLATVAAARLGPTRVAGQATLWLATMLLGALLALIGQTYQTGADTWELFATWTVLALPWTFAARNAAQWLTWAALLNIAAGLWLALAQDSQWFGARNHTTWLGALNVLLLALWEIAGRRWPEFAGHAGRWLLAAAAVSMLSMAAMDDLFFENFETDSAGKFGMFGLPSAVWCAATLAIGAFYLRVRRDPAVLAMLALGIVAVTTALLTRILLTGDEGDPMRHLAIALSVVVQAACAAVVLRRLARGEAA